MFKHNKQYLSIVHLLALFLMLQTHSANSQAIDDIHIRANYMKFDLTTGSSTYLGEVKINQGKIEIQGEKIVVHRQQDKIQRIHIEGQPARYSQDEASKDKIFARSQQMLYLTDKQHLIMTIDARLEQPNRTIESQRIVYDTKNKVVIAGNDEQNPQAGRVNITLTPKQGDSATSDQSEKKQ